MSWFFNVLLGLLELFNKKQPEKQNKVEETIEMARARHLNNGKCPKCEEILKKYPGLDEELYTWFISYQRLVKEAHVSCAGRGKADQEDALKRKVSKASYGKSPHNFNQAIDLFRINVHGTAEWDVTWYRNFVLPGVLMNPNLVWGGNWTSFKDYPHIEKKDWKEKVASGKAQLVEPE